jgi:hypothetical protein
LETQFQFLHIREKDGQLNMRLLLSTLKNKSRMTKRKIGGSIMPNLVIWLTMKVVKSLQLKDKLESSHHPLCKCKEEKDLMQIHGGVKETLNLQKSLMLSGTLLTIQQIPKHSIRRFNFKDISCLHITVKIPLQLLHTSTIWALHTLNYKV